MAIKVAGLTALQQMFTENEARYLKIADLPEYSLVKLATATSGAFASYQLQKDGTAVGATLDVPKDFLVKSATLETVDTVDTPVTGYAVGDKYLDFVINSIDNDDTAQHIYINVADLVDTYTAGNGIDITGNAISVKVDATNANGLSVGADGLAMAVASSTTTGVITPAMFNKWDNAADANLSLGTPTGTGNVVTGLSVDSSTGELIAAKDITALQESDIELITAAEVQTIYGTASSGN